MLTKLLMHKKTVSTLPSKISKRLLLALLILTCVSSGLSILAGSQWDSTVIHSSGNLRVDGVGVFQDANCSVPVKYLDWGTLEPGSAKNVTLHIRNEGNYPATIILATGNWKPVNASNYMALTWNYDGKAVSPMEHIEVILTFSLSSAVIDIADFSFDVIFETRS